MDEADTKLYNASSLEVDPSRMYTVHESWYKPLTWHVKQPLKEPILRVGRKDKALREALSTKLKITKTLPFYTYLETDFVSEISRPVECISVAFVFQLSIFSRIPGIRALCFFDHLVMVTRSSTGTSLTSALEGWKLCTSTNGIIEGVEEENDDRLLGDEWGLASGLI
nr:hypothetical protein CR513_24113 [Ipomoea batatas]